MSSYALRKAIKAALTAAVAPTKVYSGRAPDLAAFPYVVIGTSTAADMARYEDTQRETTRIHVYSKAANDVEVQTILATIRGALHEQRLTLESGHLAGLRVRSVQTLPDVDERTFMGMASVEAIHQ